MSINYKHIMQQTSRNHILIYRKTLVLQENISMAFIAIKVACNFISFSLQTKFVDKSLVLVTAVSTKGLDN